MADLSCHVRPFALSALLYIAAVRHMLDVGQQLLQQNIQQQQIQLQQQQQGLTMPVLQQQQQQQQLAQGQPCFKFGFHKPPFRSVDHLQ
jgi:hypothetical protein